MADKLPAGAKVLQEAKPSKDVTGQFISGLDDVTSLLAYPFEALLPSIVFSDEGIEVLSPEETMSRRKMGLLGVPGRATTEPTGIFEHAARFGGATLAAGPVLGRVAGLVRTPAQAATRMGRIAQFPQKMAAEMGQSFARAPISKTLVEAGAGATAGAGGYIATKAFPDSLGARIVGEVIGGLAPALTPTRLVVRAAGGTRALFNRMRHPFTSGGGRQRATARIKRAVTPEQVGRAEAALKKPTTIDPETGLPVLTPAQRAGEPGLLALERSVMETSEGLARRADEQISHANEIIQRSLREISGPPEAASFEDARSYLRYLLDTRIRIATQHVDDRLSALGPRITREESNNIAREELRRALLAAREQEKELFDLIPEGASVPFSSIKATYESFKAQLSRAQRADIPNIAKRFLEKNSDEFFGKTKTPKIFVEVTTIKELRGLQSKLREAARIARSNNKFNRARIADGLADSITDDLSLTRGGEETADAISAAVSFSRDLNERFHTGTVAKLLQRGLQGEKVPSGLTLEASLGLSGARARQAMDDIIRAFDSQEAPASGLVIEAAEDYMRNRFLRTAVQQGRLNTRTARRFLANNEELLKRMPKVSRQIEEAIDSGEALSLAAKQIDPRISKAAMLVERGPVQTFRQISGMKPQAAAKEVQEMIDMVASDSSGEAMRGLKAGFIEASLAEAKGTVRDIRGLPFISGFALRDALSAPGMRAAANKLFTPDELNRIGVITRDLIRIEQRRLARPALEGILGDTPHKTLDALAGITGAAIGRTEARRMGIGGTVQIPGILANRARELVRAGIKDPASRLIQDAIENETLFRDLLMSPLGEGGTKMTPVAQRHLHAWALGVLAEHGHITKEPDKEPEPLPFGARTLQ